MARGCLLYRILISFWQNGMGDVHFLWGRKGRFREDRVPAKCL